MKLKAIVPILAIALAGCSMQNANAETKAYWRFEDGTPGDYSAVGFKVGADSAERNPLAVAARETRPLYTGDVPFGTIPQTGDANKIAIELSYAGDFFSPDVPVDSFDFGVKGSNAWTVEMSFKMTSVDGVSRLFGRDNVTPGVDDRGPLQIVVVGNNEKFDVRAEILDGGNTFRDAISPANLKIGQWYNLAATADGKSLKLYLDALDGKGYQMVAQKPIEGALNSTLGLFSIGRGFVKNPTDNMSGLLDEVRLSDTTLTPAQFLFARPNGTGVTAAPAFYQAPAPVKIFSGADPDTEYFDGKFWMYITSQNNIGPKNPVLYAFSSPDLKGWTKTAQPIFQFKNAPWIAANGREGNYAWAPCAIEKDGKFYLYYSVGPQSADTPARVGVAVGNSPGGTFVDSGKALITGSNGFEAIDPDVFKDPKSGKYYLYAGGSAGAKLRIWEMAPDLVNVVKEIPVETPPQFTEGTFMHYENGRYYLSYSHGFYGGASYSVHYATSDSPVGPWQYRGPILRSDLTRKGPGHHSFVKDPRSGQWYIVYHRWQSPNNGNPFKAPGGRSIDIQPIYYDATGAILPIEMDDNVPVLLTAPRTAAVPPLTLRVNPAYELGKNKNAMAQAAR